MLCMTVVGYQLGNVIWTILCFVIFTDGSCGWYYCWLTLL